MQKFIWLDKNLSSEFFDMDNVWRFTKDSMNIEIYSKIHTDYDGELISNQIIDMESANIKVFSINLVERLSDSALCDFVSLLMKLKCTKRIEILNVPNSQLIHLDSEISMDSGPSEVLIKCCEPESTE